MIFLFTNYTNCRFVHWHTKISIWICFLVIRSNTSPKRIPPHLTLRPQLFSKIFRKIFSPPPPYHAGSPSLFIWDNYISVSNLLSNTEPLWLLKENLKPGAKRWKIFWIPDNRVNKFSGASRRKNTLKSKPSQVYSKVPPPGERFLPIFTNPSARHSEQWLKWACLPRWCQKKIFFVVKKVWYYWKK